MAGKNGRWRAPESPSADSKGVDGSVGAVWTTARTERHPLTVAPSIWTSVRAALPAWILARVIVLATWLMAVLPWDAPQAAGGPLSDLKNLQVWDVVWYRILGEDG